MDGSWQAFLPTLTHSPASEELRWEYIVSRGDTDHVPRPWRKPRREPYWGNLSMRFEVMDSECVGRYEPDHLIRHWHILPEEQAEPGICLLSSLCHCYPLVHAQHTPLSMPFSVHICALARYLPTLFLVLAFVCCLLSTFFTDIYTHSSFCWDFFLLSCPFGLLCLMYLGTLCMFEA